MAPPVPSLAREALAWANGQLLIGVDEAGRGPLAGPVVAAAVVFPAHTSQLKLIRDSKTLSERQRDRAAALIRLTALAIGVGAASTREIDRVNIRVATALAMRRAITKAKARIVHQPTVSVARPAVCIDGIAMPEIGLDHEAMVDGDADCFTIAAAGVIAKTVRDRLMAQLAVRHPAYDWLSNRGYGTEAHRRAIGLHGPTAHHRRCFMPVAQLEIGL